MNKNNHSINIQELRREFLLQLPERIAYLDNLLIQSSVNNHADIYAFIRRLIDISCILGFNSAERLQQEFEQARSLFSTQQDVSGFRQLFDQLLHQPDKHQQHDVNDVALPGFDGLQPENPKHRIYIYFDAQKQDQLCNVLVSRGYELCVLKDNVDFVSQVDRHAKAIILVDDACVHGEKPVIEQLRNMKKHQLAGFNYLMLTHSLKLEDRLEAVREGITLIYDRYDERSAIVRAVKQVSLQMFGNRNNILLLSRDNVLNSYLDALLSYSGLSLTIVADLHNDLFDVLMRNKFDLVVIDFLVDGIACDELAQIIRQDDLLVYLPQLFLYSHTLPVNHQRIDQLNAYGEVLATYEPEAVTTAVISAIKSSSESYRRGQFMSDALRETENQKIALDAHSIVSAADTNGKIIYVNQKFCSVSGYDRDELIGRKHNIVNSGIHPPQFFKKMWRDISNGKIWQGEICNRRKNGELYWVESTIVPFMDSHGVAYQYVSIRTEITHLKDVEEKLRISENRLIRSQWFANIGTWDWNIQTGELYWSPKIGPLFGYQEGELETTYDNFLNAVHPADRQAVIDAVNGCVRDGMDYEIEHRCVWPNGEIRWMLERGDVVRDSQGQPLHMLGVVQDITDRKNAELQVLRQKNLLLFLKDGLTRYVDEGDFFVAADGILRDLLKISESQYGFAGEVIYEGRRPYLKLHAMHNTGWDDSEVRRYRQMCSQGYEVHDIDNMLGTIIRDGQVVINNDIQLDEGPGFMPQVNVPMFSFVGIPIFHGSSLIGMYGLANKVGGYTQGDVDYLKPFSVSYSAIIHSKHLADMQNEITFALKLSKKQAEKASEAKSQFLASMSHELRTPLNAILGFGQLLSMQVDNQLSESQRDNVQEIIKAGSHLLELINEILDLSRIEAGHMDMHLVPTDVREAIAESISFVQCQAEQRGIKISYFIDNAPCDIYDNCQEPVNIYADNIRLKQIILNLVSNAIKYNKPNGEVDIYIETHGSSLVRVKVTDTGIGIAADKQHELFQSFQRLGAEATEVEGTGIGLIITRKLVELMGGSIGFESRQGAGSSFWVDLLACDGGEQHERSAKKDMFTLSLLPEKTVIYIEDNDANLRLMAQILSSLEHVTLFTAHESATGLRLISEHKPDLILLDINLPDMDGIELLVRLKQNSRLARIPVIAISANAMKEDIESALAAGFTDYITKPINMDRLLKVLKHNLLEKQS